MKLLKKGGQTTTTTTTTTTPTRGRIIVPDGIYSVGDKNQALKKTREKNGLFEKKPGFIVFFFLKISFFLPTLWGEVGRAGGRMGEVEIINRVTAKQRRSYYKKRNNIRCGGTQIDSTLPYSLHGGFNLLKWGIYELPRQIEVALNRWSLNFILLPKLIAKKLHVNQPLKFCSFLLISPAIDKT